MPVGHADHRVWVHGNTLFAICCSHAFHTMKYLAAIIRGLHAAVGITLPSPEQEKAVTLIWLLAAIVMIAIILGTGWLVLKSMSGSMSYR